MDTSAPLRGEEQGSSVGLRNALDETDDGCSVTLLPSHMIATPAAWPSAPLRGHGQRNWPRGLEAAAQEQARDEPVAGVGIRQTKEAPADNRMVEFSIEPSGALFRTVSIPGGSVKHCKAGPGGRQSFSFPARDALDDRNAGGIRSLRDSGPRPRG